MFGKRNVRRAFTSRYLSSKGGVDLRGKGLAGDFFFFYLAAAARLCHGRLRGDGAS